MKNRLENLTVFIVLISIFFLFITLLLFISSCSDEKAPVNPQTLQFNALKGDWNIESVMLDEQELQGYDGFKLVFSESTIPFVYEYQCTNRPDLSPWKANGLWKFGNTIALNLIRDQGTSDELEIEYSHTDNQLIIRFTFTGGGYGNRLESANGDWVFTFSR
jgi:hypothetical protein